MQAAKWQQWMAGNAVTKAPTQDGAQARPAPAKQVVPFQSAHAQGNTSAGSPLSELAIEEMVSLESMQLEVQLQVRAEMEKFQADVVPGMVRAMVQPVHQQYEAGFGA